MGMRCRLWQQNPRMQVKRSLTAQRAKGLARENA